MKKPETLPDSDGAWGSATESIAQRINVLHRETEAHRTQALLKARNCGELLLEVKATLKHGEWLTWLADNFGGSQATAWRYMRVASRWHVLANYSHVNSLSVTEAVRLARYGYEGGGA